MENLEPIINHDCEKIDPTYRERSAIEINKAAAGSDELLRVGMGSYVPADEEKCVDHHYQDAKLSENKYVSQCGLLVHKLRDYHVNGPKFYTHTTQTHPIRKG